MYDWPRNPKLISTTELRVVLLNGTPKQSKPSSTGIPHFRGGKKKNGDEEGAEVEGYT